MKKVIQFLVVVMLFCLPFILWGCLKASQSSIDGDDRTPLEVKRQLLTGRAAATCERASEPAACGRAVSESARDIPVAYDVDVVVVGGTSGGVAAAVEAAQKGAKVFLAAQRPYLGADICGTYRLWLEPDEVPTSPLAQKVFAQSPVASLGSQGLRFTYQADKPSAGVHKDTATPSVLTDGKWHSASTQSVQYDGDVTITADLAKERQLKMVHVMIYQRRNPGLSDDFEVDSVNISVSNDKQQWKKVAVIKNERVGEALNEPWGPIDLSTAVTEQVRYVKLLVKKSTDVNRILLGEIVIEDEESSTRPARAQRRAIVATPMQVKRALDEALLEAGVEFLYGCYATDVLTDGAGNVAGIVMANRSGRQAVRAKVIIDATPRATAARMAGVVFKPYPVGLQSFKRIVIGGEMQTGEDIQARKMPVSIEGHKAIEYTLKIPMKDGSFASFVQAEQIARDKTWHPGQVDASEILFQVPPEAMKAKKSLSGDWPGAAKVSLDVFRPVDIKRLYVLGACADMSRAAAEKLLSPLELMSAGGRIGAAAASEAKRIRSVRKVRLQGAPTSPVASGDVRENLAGIRLGKAQGVVPADQRAVPVLGQYDVVVVGGGTGGAPAGISAARQGARTLVVEYLHGLGGVGTMGLISKYYYGYIQGFTKEVDAGVASLSPDGRNTSPAWSLKLKQEWYRRELRKAGADIWFGTLGCGAFVEDGRVKGVVVATPQGRGVVLAEVVIDSTGNADVAAAECVYTNGTGVAVQGAGLPPVKLGTGYTNTDWTFIDDADVVDVWRAYVVAKKKYKDAYDLGQLVDTRERRRIVGDFTLSPMDITLGRTFPDTVVIARSNFDSHGFTVHSLFMLRPPDRKAMLVNVPYRCLLPKGLNGILVTGLGVSAHRDAMPVIRMQADIQNQGYAAGLIAATTTKTDKPLRDVDIKAIQKQLVSKSNLPEKVLTDKDSLPMPKARIAEAVNNLENDFEDLEVVLAHLNDAMPLLREAYSQVVGSKAKLTYAHVLGMLGDPAGTDTLLEAVELEPWDKGWNYTGMGQFGMSLSPLDSLIIALGRTRNKLALAPILEKTEQLDANSEFSHCRAVAMALETLGDAAAVKSLAKLLKKPGVRGHAFTDINEARSRTPASRTDTKTRNTSLRELVLARALYRCGDYEGLGEKVLKEYTRDLRGHYAHHAQAVLEEKPSKP